VRFQVSALVVIYTVGSCCWPLATGSFRARKYGSGPSHKTLYRSCLIQSGGPVEAPDLPLGATSRSASVPPPRNKALGASFRLRRSCHGMTMPRNRWRSHWRDDGRVLLGPLGRGADVHRGPLNNLKYDLTSSDLTWSRHAYKESGGLGAGRDRPASCCGRGHRAARTTAT
jgi:hypothetical protein